MTLIDLRIMAETVRDHAVDQDDEAAHIAEDKLLCACLQAIADGIEHPQEAALIGLSTRCLDFGRWHS